MKSKSKNIMVCLSKDNTKEYNIDTTVLMIHLWKLSREQSNILN